jgi:hypothetical protein
MVGVKLDGRLGNQLFQFAFIYVIARKLRTSFYIDKLPHRIQFYKYFELKGFGWVSHFYSYAIGTVQKILGMIKPAKNEEPADNTLYKGFFQSETYFGEYQKDIQELFRIRAKYVAAFNTKYGALFREKKTLVIHIRRTDYLTHGGPEVGGPNVALPESFYTQALATIPDLDQYHLIVIGDDMPFARNLFKAYPAVSYEQNPFIIDFQLMMNADRLIISNSTFAWWAAYLNKKQPEITAPRYWMGFKIDREFPPGITCANWQLITSK